jgi:uncharacterized delta-60 repeat protein
MLALRYNTDGTPDSTFSGNGNIQIDITIYEESANAVAVQDDGKIVLAGMTNYDFYTVARLTTAGTLDTSFGDDGIMFANLNPDYDLAISVAIQADGAIMTVGLSGGGSNGRASAARFLVS